MSTTKLQNEVMSELKELLANIPPFGLRMQADLKDRMKKAAELNNRSMNAEIVARLEESENVEKFLADFQLAKQRILDQEAVINDLRKGLESTGLIAADAQDISRQLIQVLMSRLGVPEEEIKSISRPGQ